MSVSVKKTLLICLLSLLISHFSEAQNFYFEPQLGTAYVGYWGENTVADSIKVEANNHSEKAIILILNSCYSLTNRLELGASITFFSHFPSYSVYNQSLNAQIGGFTIVKVGDQNLTDFQFSLYPKFMFIRISDFKVYGFLTPSLHLTINKKGDYIPLDPDTDFKGQLPTVSKVLNSFKESSEKVFFSLGFGGSVYWRKMGLTIIYTENISRTITNNLTVDGISFPFNNTFSRLSITLGYQFNFESKKKKHMEPPTNFDAFLN